MLFFCYSYIPFSKISIARKFDYYSRMFIFSIFLILKTKANHVFLLRFPLIFRFLKVYPLIHFLFTFLSLFFHSFVNVVYFLFVYFLLCSCGLIASKKKTTKHFDKFRNAFKYENTK